MNSKSWLSSQKIDRQADAFNDVEHENVLGLEHEDLSDGSVTSLVWGKLPGHVETYHRIQISEVKI